MSLFFKKNTPVKYCTETIEIDGNVHNLILPQEMFVSENLQLSHLIEKYFKEAVDDFNNGGVGRDSCVALRLLNILPMSLAEDISTIEHCLGIYLDGSTTKLEIETDKYLELIDTINIVIDPRFIDVMIGRFFKQMIRSYGGPDNVLDEDIATNIIQLYRYFKHVWILPLYRLNMFDKRDKFNTSKDVTEIRV